MEQIQNQVDCSDKSLLKTDFSNESTGPDGRGSLFCSYNETSSNYNSTRRQLGVGIIIGSIRMSGFPLSKIRLLDIGCGTGNFIAEVWPMLEHITGLEVNDGMLSQAKANLKDALEAGVLNLVQSAAIDLDFDSESYHAVTINVVIHHFPKENNFDYLKQVFKKVYNVLKYGGCFILTHCLPQQTKDGLWWAALIPEAVKDYCERSPSLELIIQYLRDVGFTINEGEIITPLLGTLQVPYLEKYGINGAFEQEYRDGDSTWSVAESTGELETCKAEIRKMQKNGTAENWLKKREEIRKRSGQITIFVARKLKQATKGECIISTRL